MCEPLTHVHVSFPMSLGPEPEKILTVDDYVERSMTSMDAPKPKDVLANLIAYLAAKGLISAEDLAKIVPSHHYKIEV